MEYKPCYNLRNMEWIDIKERLPRDYQKIIVGRKGEENIVQTMTYRDRYKNQENWGTTMIDYFAKPTHWMPVPKAPK